MRDKMLGRWMIRLVVATGAGMVALGAASAAANATGLPQRTVTASQVGALTVVGAVQAAQTTPEPIYVTEDYTWT